MHKMLAANFSINQGLHQDLHNTHAHAHTHTGTYKHTRVHTDVVQRECLFGWKAHEGNVHNIQFSSDETSVYSMGEDRRFSQWNVMKSGAKVVDFEIHENACQPAASWIQKGGGVGEGGGGGGGGGGGMYRYYPNIPRGNLFAFESEDKFVLTCSPQEAIVYQVSELKGDAKCLPEDCTCT